MNLKDNKLLVSVLILTTTLLTAGSSVSAAQQTPFDRLISKFREGQIFRAEFSHEYADTYTGETDSVSGTIWVGEDKYKVRNRVQEVVVDGETSKVYDQSKNRVLISEYVPEEDDFAPSRFLNGADSTYSVVEQKASGENTVIVLDSDDPFAVFKRVEITLGPNLIPQKIFVKDQADNLITTTFSSGTFISRQKNLFVLNYPDDAEVIDMRN